jgi:uncharacterized protein (TIGR02246 family)
MPPQSPQEVAHGFAEAWDRGDADGLAELFAADADFVNVVGLWWTRREQIRRNHAYGFTHIFPGSTMSVDRLRVRELGDEVAVVHVRWSVEGQVDPRGGPAPDRHGVLVLVTQRQADGTWLAVAAQNTDLVPGAQTHVVEQDGMRADHYGGPVPS